MKWILILLATSLLALAQDDPTPMTLSLDGSPRASTKRTKETPAPQPSPKAGQTLPQELINAVVVISGQDGRGTGFICNFHGKPLVVTNQHVLAAGSPLTIRASDGELLTAQAFFAATDTDIALIQCASIPAQITPLNLAALPDPSIHPEDPVIIPGNSEGGEVITQTPGKLLAVGPRRVEVDNPVFHGNSGGPIIHVASKKVIGILTEAELVTLDQFDKASFRSKNSAIKSEIRYFGTRIDSVQKWEPLNWQVFQQTERLLNQSRTELDDIFAYINDSSSRYTNFDDLYSAINTARVICNDKNHSIEDKKEAYQRFLRDLGALARRANERLDNRKIYFQQQKRADTIAQMSAWVLGSTVIAKRDNDLVTSLLQSGN